jgi:hypothetical protein
LPAGDTGIPPVGLATPRVASRLEAGKFMRELLKIHFNREGCEEREGLKTKLYYIIQYIIKQAAACFHVFLRTLRALRG